MPFKLTERYIPQTLRTGCGIRGYGSSVCGKTWTSAAPNNYSESIHWSDAALLVLLLLIVLEGIRYSVYAMLLCAIVFMAVRAWEDGDRLTLGFV